MAGTSSCLAERLRRFFTTLYHSLPCSQTLAYMRCLSVSLSLAHTQRYNKPEECSLDEFQFWRYNGDKALMLFKHYCFAVFFLLAVLGHLPFFRREEGNASDPQNGQSDNTNAIDIGIPANNSTIEIPRIV